MNRKRLLVLASVSSVSALIGGVFGAAIVATTHPSPISATVPGSHAAARTPAMSFGVGQVHVPPVAPLSGTNGALSPSDPLPHWKATGNQAQPARVAAALAVALATAQPYSAVAKLDQSPNFRSDWNNARAAVWAKIDANGALRLVPVGVAVSTLPAPSSASASYKAWDASVIVRGVGRNGKPALIPGFSMTSTHTPGHFSIVKTPGAPVRYGVMNVTILTKTTTAGTTDQALLVPAPYPMGNSHSQAWRRLTAGPPIPKGANPAQFPRVVMTALPVGA